MAAVKLALKVGPDRFYQFIRDFGFGSRTGIELPGETRGLLRPVNKWGASSIGSIAIGQEVGVTPLQLVSMVSTIANGGVYLPPHVLMPGQVDADAQAQTLQPVAFQARRRAAQSAACRRASRAFRDDRRPDAQDDGGRGALRHRQTRPAQRLLLRRQNRHGAKDRSGHAPLFEDHAHRFVCRNCAGQQSCHRRGRGHRRPKGAYYGTAVSAPVFAEVAQQVLEYLCVPHDIDARRPHALSKADLRMAEDDSHEQTGDINALYAAANDLPSDDPLRASATQAPPASPLATSSKSQSSAQPANANASPATAQQQPRTPNTVTIADGKALRVPSLIGLPVRKVIEQAAAAGLEVEINGSGTVREQAPAPGTMVAPGTRIVVRCGR